MGKNYKLYFKYIHFNLAHLYLFYTKKNFYNISIILPTLTFYYTSLHVRFSSLFFSTQLVDLFAYDLPLSFKGTDLKSNPSPVKAPRVADSIVVYNYHHLFSQDRFFFFCVDSLKTSIQSSFNLSSIGELFPNAS
jgi:hypothetical protein